MFGVLDDGFLFAAKNELIVGDLTHDNFRYDKQPKQGCSVGFRNGDDVEHQPFSALSVNPHRAYSCRQSMTFEPAVRFMTPT